MKTLDKCTNFYGKLDPTIKERIKRFLNSPTPETWDDICGIIIDGNSFCTIWQAVIVIDPTFPQSGRSTDIEGNILQEWERIPSPLQVLQAIKRRFD